MRIVLIVTLYAATVMFSALSYGTISQAVAAGRNPASDWRDCQSADENKRLVGCTAVIGAQGYGLPSRLADAFDARCWAHNVKQQFAQAINDCLASAPPRPWRFSSCLNSSITEADRVEHDLHQSVGMHPRSRCPGW